MSDDIIKQVLDLFYNRDFWKKALDEADKKKSEELAWKIHDILPEGESIATVLSALYNATFITLLECVLSYREEKALGKR